MKTNQDEVYDFQDHEVIDQVLSGERETFELLMRKYNQRLFRLGMSYLHEESDVEDAMQNTYLKAYKGLPGFRGEAKFSTWLMRIMINECLQFVRKTRPYERVDLTETLPAQVITSESGEAILIKKEMKVLLENAILALPSKYRSVYLMREVEGLSTQETAMALDISESNVKIRLFRAKDLLREEILKCGDGVEVFPFRFGRCDSLVAEVMRQIMDDRT